MNEAVGAYGQRIGHFVTVSVQRGLDASDPLPAASLTTKPFVSMIAAIAGILAPAGALIIRAATGLGSVAPTEP